MTRSDSIDTVQLHRDIGGIQARMDALERAQAQNTETLQEIKTCLAELRGGRKALGWIVGAAATAGAGVSWLMKHVTINGG